MYDHIGSCLSQRALAREAGTAQSVVARIELEQTIPSFVTLTELLAAAGFDLATDLLPRPRVDRAQLDVRARRGRPAIVEWKVSRTDPAATSFAVVVADGNISRRREVHEASARR